MRRIALLHRRPDLTRAEFTEYWRDRHGPFVAASPGYSQLRSRYAQSHIEHDIGDFAFDGIADVVVASATPGDGPSAPSAAQQRTLAERLAADESVFLDRERSIAAGFEIVEWSGAGTAHKMMVLAAGGTSDLPIARFRDAPGCVGFRWSRRVDAWRGLATNVPSSPIDIDVVLEFEVESEDRLDVLLGDGSRFLERSARPPGAYERVVGAREYVLFDSSVAPVRDPN